MKLRALLVCLGLVCLLARAAPAQPAEVSRVLHTFDFEERALGNDEDLPMNWSKVEGTGLPRYVNGFLSTERARSGQYSFQFKLNGGSLIYRYDSGRIKVQKDARYRVEGFVQTTPMQNARARISAYLTDIDGHPIAGSVRRSSLFASSNGDAGQWKPLSVELTVDSPDAVYLVVEIGLLQPSAYGSSSLGTHVLWPQDIYGNAWFDDITVAQVPQVSMSTDRPANIFRRGDARSLSVIVNDRFTDDLAARLVVRNADGQPVYQNSAALDQSMARPLGPGREQVTLTLPGELPAGWYASTLEISSHGRAVGTHELDFILLADDDAPLAPDPRFGLIATSLPVEGWSQLPDILPTLAAGRVKLALWSEQGDIEQLDAGGFDRLLEKLQDLQITPTACLLALPPSVRDKIRARRNSLAESSLDAQAVLASAAEDSWTQILNAPLETWQPQLAYLIARHANHLDRWQLGDDGSDAFVNQPHMREVYRRVYEQFSDLIQKPDLAMPWPAWCELSGDMPATVALHVPPNVLPSQLPLYMADVRGDGNGGANGSANGATPRNFSIDLEALNRAQYGRTTQLRDLAQRIAYALAANAPRIDLQLPFNVSRSGDDLDRQPQETLLVLRTILRTLGNSTFKGKVPIADGVEAFLFDRDGDGTLMLWNQGNSSELKQLAINLGPRPMRVDLFGNVSPLLWSDNPNDRTLRGSSATLELGPMPIFLTGIDAQLAQLRASIAFDNDRLESSLKAHTRTLTFSNPYRVAISGTVRLTAPKGWTINPPTQSFNLEPGESLSREMTIEFPYNSFAGAKTIVADFKMQADRDEQFSVPLTLKLGLSDVGLQAIALRDGDDVIVQQMITNYGERPIDYSAYAIFPGQARQERLVTALAPGRTTIKKYRFVGVSAPMGTRIRNGVKELVGTRVLNDEVPIQ